MNQNTLQLDGDLTAKHFSASEKLLNAAAQTDFYLRQDDTTLVCPRCDKLYAGDNPEFDCQCSTTPFLEFGKTAMDDLVNLASKLDLTTIVIPEVDDK